jgi:hypothetical protein
MSEIYVAMIFNEYKSVYIHGPASGLFDWDRGKVLLKDDPKDLDPAVLPDEVAVALARKGWLMVEEITPTENPAVKRIPDRMWRIRPTKHASW